MPAQDRRTAEPVHQKGVAENGIDQLEVLINFWVKWVTFLLTFLGLSHEVSVDGVPPLSLTLVESKLCTTEHTCLELICLKDLAFNPVCSNQHARFKLKGTNSNLHAKRFIGWTESTRRRFRSTVWIRVDAG